MFVGEPESLRPLTEGWIEVTFQKRHQPADVAAEKHSREGVKIR